MNGKITYYNDERGFGFIKSTTGDDYFFHISVIIGTEQEVTFGENVEFEVETYNGKSKAIEVILNPSNSGFPKGQTPQRKRTFDHTPDYAGEFTHLTEDQISASLAEISNWKLEAKLEDLLKYFVSIPEVDQIREGKKSYVIGRKGTGKTAIVSYLADFKHGDASSDKLSFKNFPFNDLYQLENNEYTKPNQYITLWKYIIYSTVVRMMADRPSVDPLLRKKIRKIYPEPNASDLKGLLRRWTAGDFSISVLGSGFSFANWLSKKKDTTWIERADHLEKFIVHNCDSSTYLVLFDELDEDYKNMLTKYLDGGYIHLLTGLFKAVQDIRGIMDKSGKNILPIIFLRDDIFDLITDSDKNKWRDLTTHLDWNLVEIKNLLKHRIEKASGVTSDEFLKSWHSIFDNNSIPYAKGRKSLQSFDYITRSTHGRPRDFIQYLRVCAESQIAIGGGRISEKTVINADKAYSNYLLNELTDEIHGIIPDIANVFRVLSQIRKWILSVEEFTKVYNDYVGMDQIKTKDAGFVLQTLFYFSVIGNVSRNHQVHIFRHEHKEAVFNFSENIVIHRGLMKALQIL